MQGAPASHASDIERVFRAEHGRAVAVLVRAFGDIDLAEEAVQDAFAAAVKRWPDTGPPPSPAGWIITTARNRAIDRLRREAPATTATRRPPCFMPVASRPPAGRWATSGCD
jgi:RNA polymerase sigma-70 factor (ECF subfamily)